MLATPKLDTKTKAKTNHENFICRELKSNFFFLPWSSDISDRAHENLEFRLHHRQSSKAASSWLRYFVRWFRSILKFEWYESKNLKFSMKIISQNCTNSYFLHTRALFFNEVLSNNPRIFIISSSGSLLISIASWLCWTYCRRGSRSKWNFKNLLFYYSRTQRKVELSFELRWKSRPPNVYNKFDCSQNFQIIIEPSLHWVKSVELVSKWVVADRQVLRSMKDGDDPDLEAKTENVPNRDILETEKDRKVHVTHVKTNQEAETGITDAQDHRINESAIAPGRKVLLGKIHQTGMIRDDGRTICLLRTQHHSDLNEGDTLTRKTIFYKNVDQNASW